MVATIPVGNGPFGAAYDSGKGEIFVPNLNTNTVSVISDSTNTVIATIPVEADPEGVAYDSGKGEIFLVNQNPDTVSVISDSTNTVVATLTLGNGTDAGVASGVAYDSGMGEIFVTNIGNGTVSAISDSTNALIAISSSPTTPIPTIPPPSSSATVPAGAGSWVEKAPMPSDGSGDGAAVVNGIIYVFGPTDYAYNPGTDTWTTIAPMLTPRS